MSNKKEKRVWDWRPAADIFTGFLFFEVLAGTFVRNFSLMTIGLSFLAAIAPFLGLNQATEAFRLMVIAVMGIWILFYVGFGRPKLVKRTNYAWDKFREGEPLLPALQKSISRTELLTVLVLGLLLLGVFMLLWVNL